MPWALNIQIWLCFERCTSATPWSLKNLHNLIEDCLGIFTLTLWWSSTAPSWTPSGHGTLKPASMRRCTVPCTWQTEEKNGDKISTWKSEVRYSVAVFFRRRQWKNQSAVLWWQTIEPRLKLKCNENSSCCACRILSKIAMPLMDVSLMHQSLGVLPWTLAENCHPFLLRKFQVSILSSPFVGFLLLLCCWFRFAFL